MDLRIKRWYIQIAFSFSIEPLNSIRGLEGCPPGGSFLLWSILDREATDVSGVDLSPEEFRKASEPIKERTGRNELRFAEWLKKRKEKKDSRSSKP